MIFLLGVSGFFVIFLIGYLLTRITHASYEARDFWGIGAILGGLILALILIIWGISRFGDIPAGIKQFEATKETLVTARLNPNITPLELAAIQQKVIDANRWLASSQFWAKSPLTNWFWPKAIFALQSIK
jgi:hypothetical protein